MLSGFGLGWRPETAQFVHSHPEITFTEVIAENLYKKERLPDVVVEIAKHKGVVPHGISLSLGSAEGIDMKRVDRLARLAESLGSPCVSEHLSFVTADGVDVGHLTPIAYTDEMLERVVRNVRTATSILPVPLVIENVASLFEWPENAMDESQFLSTLLEETQTHLLLDVANLYANSVNLGVDVDSYLRALPLHRIAYMHVAGGVQHGDTFFDTHAHPVSDGALDVLRKARALGVSAPALLEWDDDFPGYARMTQEITRLNSQDVQHQFESVARRAS